MRGANELRVKVEDGIFVAPCLAKSGNQNLEHDGPASILRVLNQIRVFFWVLGMAKPSQPSP